MVAVPVGQQCCEAATDTGWKKLSVPSPPSEDGGMSGAGASKELEWTSLPLLPLSLLDSFPHLSPAAGPPERLLMPRSCLYGVGWTQIRSLAWL